MENKELFTYVDSKNVKRSIEISEGDFQLVQENVHLHDEAIKSKPTTFFKDAMKRFAKNKSSVAGAIILGTIVVLSVVLPFVLPSDIDGIHPYETFLAPKVFEAGTGWWDGCLEYNDIVVDIDWDHYEETVELTGFPVGYESRAIIGGQEGVRMTAFGERKTNSRSDYAHGGYIRYSTPSGTNEVVELTSPTERFYFDYYSYSLDFSFSELQGIANAEQASYALYFVDYTDPENPSDILLKDFSTQVGEFSVALSPTEYPELIGSIPGALSIRLDKPGAVEKDLLIKQVIFNVAKQTVEPSEEAIARMKAMSIIDANKSLGYTFSDNPELFWQCPSPAGRSVHQADIIYGSFRFDTYEKMYGEFRRVVSDEALNTYMKKGYITGNSISVDELKAQLRALPTKEKRLELADAFLASLRLTPEGELHCPFRVGEGYDNIARVTGAGSFLVFEIDGIVSRYRELGYTTMPKYFMGTDSKGKDLLHYTFAGLRTSLVLGIVSAAVCFSFGLVWGAISGYFGGWVDIWMERFCDILGGLPWIVLMTFMMIKFGQNYFVFAVAICLTGWMGTAHLTRTQFYRFKDREYILAARTLGASDVRLIFRHILPNAVGTIVTSAVLMIPSTIYSEASIAYLGLGLRDVASFGVMLSNNQAYLGQYPNLILFPSAIMALMMISFNLFGNGLRDAFNPSLKGQD